MLRSMDDAQRNQMEFPSWHKIDIIEYCVGLHNRISNDSQQHKRVGILNFAVLHNNSNTYCPVILVAAKQILKAEIVHNITDHVMSHEQQDPDIGHVMSHEQEDSVMVR